MDKPDCKFTGDENIFEIMGNAKKSLMARHGYKDGAPLVQSMMSEVLKATSYEGAKNVIREYVNQTL